MFHKHRHVRTSANFTPAKEVGNYTVDGGREPSYLMERIMLGFTTIVRTCECGDEIVRIVVGDARATP